MRLTDFLDKGASLHPGDAPCLTMAGQTRTYTGVQRLSWSVGRALARSGIRPGVEVWPDLPRSRVGKVLKSEVRSRLLTRPRPG